LYADTTPPHLMKEMCKCVLRTDGFGATGLLPCSVVLIFILVSISWSSYISVPFGILQIHWCWWFCYLVSCLSYVSFIPILLISLLLPFPHFAVDLISFLQGVQLKVDLF